MNLINLKQSILHNSLISKILFNSFNLRLSKTLLNNGLVTHYKKLKIKNKIYILLYLKYYQQKNVIRDIRVVSKPSKIISTNNKNLNKKKNSLLLSNSSGTFLQSNIKRCSIGGNALFFINC